MKTLDKILHFLPAGSIALFIIFFISGVVCGELHVKFPRFLMALCALYFAVIGVVVAMRSVFFLAKPVKLAKKKIRKLWRLLKYLLRSAFSDEEDFF